jgi:hypothetical protein
MVTIVVGKGEIVQTDLPGLFRPGLQEVRRIRLNPMTLRMTVIIGSKHWSNGVTEQWSDGVWE